MTFHWQIGDIELAKQGTYYIAEYNKYMVTRESGVTGRDSSGTIALCWWWYK